jgi:uncharacterized membrane protein YfcA
VTTWELVVVALAGGAAGFVNAVAGSGTLITFPTLLAFGVPPVTANVSNNVGLVPGAVSGALGSRPELTGQRQRVRRLVSAALVGGVVGAVLLLVLPTGAFDAIVPVLIGLGVLLVACQPLITRRAVTPAGSSRHSGRSETASVVEPVETRDAWWLWPVVALTGVYGGYFGAAQGILLIAVLGLGTADTLLRTNALKNVLAGLVNGVAAVVFVVFADVDWTIAVLIAIGSSIGAQVGIRTGRRVPSYVLRGFVIVVGLAALAVFLLD